MKATASVVEKLGKKTSVVDFVTGGISAQGHTLVYKMHKYFARRPQNVFRWLIEHYSKPGDTILDCFCGGGVSVFEGLSVGRKVVAADLNPLATFISECQVTKVDQKDYQNLISQIRETVYKHTKPYFSTNCRGCSASVDVRWFELAYLVDCPHCLSKTHVSNNQKEIRNGKTINGWYRCTSCQELLSSSIVPRTGYTLISVTYRCRDCQIQSTVSPDASDCRLLEEFEEQFPSMIKSMDLWYPKDEIPLNWDRQYEDGLKKKGITQFADFFTKRLLFANALLLKVIQGYKESVSPEMYRMLLFTFSAVIRHTNNMTISTEAWMGGRPVSWAKHAFWISNQFVEVNPIEYVEKRSKAIVSGLNHQQKELGFIKPAAVFDDLQNKGATHMILNRSSATLPIPDKSVDLVITDPPYGSNVQYSELSGFWLVWLRESLGIADQVLTSKDEVVVHRRKKLPKDFKGYDGYFLGLKDVFTECHRVLKPGGALVFTFNNKDVQAWYSVIKAAIKSGFYLDPQGVIYQEPIENYKNTAHARFDGAMQGDFVYTFIKTDETQNCSGDELKGSSKVAQTDMAGFVLKIVEEIIQEKGGQSTSNIYLEVYPKLIPLFVDLAQTEENFAQISEAWDIKNFEGILKTNFSYDRENRTWT